MEELKIGDVVQLKSGGPVMTISNIGSYSHSGGPTNGAACEWFDGKENKKEVFDVRILKKESERFV